MLLWFLFAMMAAAVVAVLSRPLWTAASMSTDTATADIAVYKDQLTEIDADAARGLIGAAEADLARREVARRLLARADAAEAVVGGAGRLLGPVRMALVGVVPLLALGGYLLVGAPHLPGRPHDAAAVALDKAPVQDLVTRVEARLATNPSDGQGWDVLAPVYFRLQRFAEAAHAYGQAAALLGETPQRLAGFAEATVLANDGLVTETARLAYEKLARLDPARPEPKFWLALAKEQDGRHAEAAADYRALLAGAPAGASWKALVEERLAVVTKAPAPGPRGPTAGDVKAADGLSDADRAAMIRGMVDSLANRLAKEPGDAKGWQRLVQSYVVLGERDKATAALADARRGLANDAAGLAELGSLAKSLGLTP